MVEIKLLTFESPLKNYEFYTEGENTFFRYYFYWYIEYVFFTYILFLFIMPLLFILFLSAIDFD